MIDRIQNQSELFSETDWNSRSVVEIRAAKKSDGWFFHAITGEEWLLKMKFRTARNTFSRDELVRRLDLKPLNDMPELPLYGTEPRVKLRSLRGPWQEIELRVIVTARSIAPSSGSSSTRRWAVSASTRSRPRRQTDILQPWKQLGRKWHFARRGFPLGGKVEWEMEVLEELVELLNETAPYGQLLWNNKQVVPLYVPQQREAWAAVQTKKLDAVYLHLTGPKGRFAQGRITGLGFDAQVNGEKTGMDVLRIKFRSTEDLHRGDLAAFLKEHLAALEKKKLMTESLLPQRFLFRFSAPCHYRDPLWKASGARTGREAPAGPPGRIGRSAGDGRGLGGVERGGTRVCRVGRREEAAGMVPRLASGG